MTSKLAFLAAVLQKEQQNFFIQSKEDGESRDNYNDSPSGTDEDLCCDIGSKHIARRSHELGNSVGSDANDKYSYEWNRSREEEEDDLKVNTERPCMNCSRNELLFTNGDKFQMSSETGKSMAYGEKDTVIVKRLWPSNERLFKNRDSYQISSGPDENNSKKDSETTEENCLKEKDWEVSEAGDGKYFLDFKSPYFTTNERIRIIEVALEDIRERYFDVKGEFQKFNRKHSRQRRKKRNHGS